MSVLNNDKMTTLMQPARRPRQEFARGPQISSGKTVILVVLVLIVFFLSQSTTRGQKELDLEKVLAAYEAACAVVPSFEVYLRERYHQVLKVRNLSASPSEWEWQAVAGEKEIISNRRLTRQHRSGQKYRGESLEVGGKTIAPNTSITAWNGAKEQVLDRVHSQATLSPYALTFPWAHGTCYLNLYKTYDGDFTYAALVRSRSRDRVSVRRDAGLIVLTAEPEPMTTKRANTIGIRLFLDPERGLMPAKIDILFATADNKSYFKAMSYNNSLVEIDPGQWLPMSCKLSGFVEPNKGRHQYWGLEKGYFLVEVDREKSRFNIDLPDSLFELEFPVGTVVSDQIRNTMYRVGAESEAVYLNSIADQARAGLIPRDDPPPRFWTRTPNAIILGIGTVLILVVSGALIGYRIHRRRRTVQ
jgi:hypothetical protein